MRVLTGRMFSQSAYNDMVNRGHRRGDGCGGDGGGGALCVRVFLRVAEEQQH